MAVCTIGSGEFMPDDLMLNVTQCATQRVIGLPTQINTADALQECFRHWQENFSPYIERMTTLPTMGFGIIPSYDPFREKFKYIASVPSIPGFRVPEDLDELEIPAGLYLESLLIMQTERYEVLEAILRQWLPGQNEYRLNPAAPIYELYPTDYPQTGLITLYVPVRRV
ncbi:hypothetical protein C4J81_18435 [Deltaproteobacteria bacterium Smac51]|nr:hypothetical protein C4J81_18435 [Deltaproteobacteria bacterium Smac51]